MDAHLSRWPAGGQVHIGNTNGKVEIEGTDGNTVEIRAERIARGVTDTAAQELLPRIEIKEDIRPDRVSVETARMSGIMFGASFEVRYHVRAPKSAVIDASNTNGLVTVTDFSGKVRAHTTNGGVTGKGLSGGVDAAATNGRSTSSSRRSVRIGLRCAPPTAASRSRCPSRRRPTSPRPAPTAASASRA
jgi:hypothetical protein